MKQCRALPASSSAKKSSMLPSREQSRRFPGTLCIFTTTLEATGSAIPPSSSRSCSLTGRVNLASYGALRKRYLSRSGMKLRLINRGCTLISASEASPSWLRFETQRGLDRCLSPIICWSRPGCSQVWRRIDLGRRAYAGQSQPLITLFSICSQPRQYITGSTLARGALWPERSSIGE